MWQDSGRYEWPLLQAPGEQTTAPATQTVLPAYDSQSLVVPWYQQAPAGPGVSSAGIVLDTRPDPEKAQQEIADLRRQVEELQARVVELEQAAERHAGTL